MNGGFGVNNSVLISQSILKPLDLSDYRLIIPIFDYCKESENLVNQSFSAHTYRTLPFLFDDTKMYKRLFIRKCSFTFFSK